jgi:hypothetical protein
MGDQVPALAGIVVVVGGTVVAEDGTVVVEGVELLVEGVELLVELLHAAVINASVTRSSAAACLVFIVTQSRLASQS